MESSSSGMGMAKYGTPNPGQMGQTEVCQSHILTVQSTTCHIRTQGSCTWEQAQVGGGEFCGIQRVVSPLVPAGGCDWLV